MVEQCLFQLIPHLLCVVNIEESCVDLIYDIAKDMWFEICCPEL